MYLSLGEFILGDDPQEFMLSWTAQDKDKWVVENVGLSRTNGELELFEKKWFDYRHLHPMDATLIFAESYKREYAKILESHGREDFRKAPFRTGLKRVPFIRLSKANITSLWKARQKADELGVDYGYFISSMLSIAARREWNELPRPQHLWQEDLLEIFTDKHNKHNQTRINGSRLSYFTTNEYVGDEIQDAHRRFVMEQFHNALPSKRPLFAYSAFYLLKYVDEQLFSSQFPEVHRKALRLV
uniref:Uncharacterized protein n=1 Tax=Pectobacterium carotovorum TaxID=554 RepID=A0A0K0MPX6_PECCA|nr:hypothetical protein [Pectobacterium carotovorum]AKG47497.1 hypothetical protein pA_00057 [Pectobacterium carotovorum]